MAKLQPHANPRVLPILTTNVHLYSVKLINDYDYSSVLISADTAADAQTSAVDEYQRQTGLLPNSAIVTLIK
jgi:hypothetical protein